MWTVFEATKTEGRTEGRAEGIITMGYEFGLSENDILDKLQKKLDISPQKAKEYLEVYRIQS